MYIEYQDDDFIHCWSCKTEMQVYTLRTNDGYCPCCDSEIQLDEEPYN